MKGGISPPSAMNNQVTGQTQTKPVPGLKTIPHAMGYSATARKTGEPAFFFVTARLVFGLGAGAAEGSS